MKETLVSIEDWAVCRYPYKHENVVYGEHITGCRELVYDNAASWGWEHGDLSENCWKCNAPVPEGVVALVLMYNWDKL